MDFEDDNGSNAPPGAEPIEFAGMTTYGETFRAAAQYLKAIRLLDKLEAFSAQGEETAQIPRFIGLACYATPGPGGGHDIFVDALDEAGTRRPVLAGTTYLGYFVACEIAGELARFLHQDST